MIHRSRLWVHDLELRLFPRLLYIDRVKSFGLELLVLPINKFFPNTKERCELWEDLVLHRVIDGLLFEVFHFDVINFILDFNSVVCAFLQRSEHFEVRHPVDEGLVHQKTWIHDHRRLERQFVDLVIIFKSELLLLSQRALESNIEVDHIVFQNVRDFLWVWKNALDCIVLFVCQINLADERWQSGFQQFDDPLWSVLIVSNDNWFPFSSFCTLLNELEGYSISDSNCMKSRIFCVLFNNFNNLRDIANTSICEQKDVSWISFDNFLFQYF